MKRKLMMLVATALCCATVVVAMPTETKAMQPCSQATIDAANAQIAAACCELEIAKQAEAAALANFNAVKASNPTELQLTVAGNAYTTAQNQTRWYLDKVNNAKAYLANITGRATMETAFEQNAVQLGNLTNMQDKKMAADNAAAIATGVAEQIKATQNAIAGYQQALAISPSVQTQIDALNVQLVALQADYAAKKAVADSKMAEYQAAVAADCYGAYSPYIINYWANRDISREHPAKCNCPACNFIGAK